MTYNRVIWLDIETTGLDPARDKILEVAFILTTPQGEELAAQDWQISQPGACRLANDYVTSMHTASGLWEECAHSIYNEDSADMAISVWLQAQGVSRRTSGGMRLGGRNVGSFDLPFLRQSRLGYSATHLPYRCLDITSVHAALEAAGYGVDLGGRDGDHRALADLRRDIALYRTYLAALRGMIRVRVTLRWSHLTRARAAEANELTSASWEEVPTCEARAGGQHTNGAEHWIGTLTISPADLSRWLAHVQPYGHEVRDVG